MSNQALTVISRSQPKKTSRLRKKDYKRKWLDKMDFILSYNNQDAAMISLFDSTSYRYIYMNDRANVLGYDTREFISHAGAQSFFNNIHPDQSSAALLVQLKALSYNIEHPSLKNHAISNMLFTYKRKDGQYIQLLQKSVIAEVDTKGNPLLYIRYGYDITHLVKPSVTLIINSVEDTLIWVYNLKTKILEQVKLLSVQEKKILKLLAEGKESKMIADMLFISSHTIDTHRRHLLKKTNCIDTTALITFAKMTGLIV